jgi:hypothetical protein
MCSGDTHAAHRRGSKRAPGKLIILVFTVALAHSSATYTSVALTRLLKTQALSASPRTTDRSANVFRWTAGRIYLVEFAQDRRDFIISELQESVSLRKNGSMSLGRSEI